MNLLLGFAQGIVEAAALAATSAAIFIGLGLRRVPGADQTDGRWAAGQILADRDILGRAYRAAAAKHHPDRNGDAVEFRRVTAARDLIAGVNADA